MTPVSGLFQKQEDGSMRITGVFGKIEGKITSCVLVLKRLHKFVNVYTQP